MYYYVVTQTRSDSTPHKQPDALNTSVVMSFDICCYYCCFGDMSRLSHLIVFGSLSLMGSR